jgi:hypothetical protein
VTRHVHGKVLGGNPKRALVALASCVRVTDPSLYTEFGKIVDYADCHKLKSFNHTTRISFVAVHARTDSGQLGDPTSPAGNYYWISAAGAQIREQDL